MRWLLAWWGMKRRGERRIAPGLRGRVFARVNDPAPGVARAEPRGYISARVIRADGTVEDLGVISEPKE